MATDDGAPPLPRRVPGATVSPGSPVRVERFVIPEDLRQRLLTAIAGELQREESEALRRAQEQGETGKPWIPGERGTAWWEDEPEVPGSTALAPTVPGSPTAPGSPAPTSA